MSRLSLKDLVSKDIIVINLNNNKESLFVRLACSKQLLKVAKVKEEDPKIP